MVFDVQKKSALIHADSLMPQFFDEMYANDTGAVCEHYREFESWLAEQSPELIEPDRLRALDRQ